MINLIATDVGRPVGHIASNLAGYDRLVPDVQEVLDSLVPKEIEVQTHTGAWFLLGIRPYRTLENVIEGAVVTFVDITQMKKAQVELRETLRRMAVVVRDSRDAITVQDLGGRILAWNPEAERMYGWSERIVEVWVSATPLVNEAGKVYAIATTERNATENSSASGGLENA